MFFSVKVVGAASNFASLEPPDTAASVSGFGDCGSGSGVGSEVDSAWDHFRNHRFFRNLTKLSQPSETNGSQILNHFCQV